LEYTPADQKSLYRRANAFERLGKLNEAISDAQRLMSISSKSGSADEPTYNLLRKLRENAQSKVFGKFIFVFFFKYFLSKKISQQTQMHSQIQQMFEMIISKSNQQETV
jgi:hypothetical protein